MCTNVSKEVVIGHLQSLLTDADLESTTEEALQQKLTDHFKQDMEPFSSDIQAEIEKFVVMAANNNGHIGKRDRENRDPDAGKSKAAKVSQDTGADKQFLLSEDGSPQCSVRDFNGSVYVDIRVHYKRDGEMRPTKKGAMLSIPEWQALVAGFPSIQAAVESKDLAYTLALSTKRKVTISDFVKGSISVDIREYYDAAGQAKPTQKGIMLKATHFKALCDLASAITAELQRRPAAAAAVASSSSAPAAAAAAGKAAQPDAAPAARGCTTATAAGEPLWWLGPSAGGKKAKFASVGTFQGKQNVSVREYFEKAGAWASTKKGLNLTLEQFETLCGHTQAVTDALAAKDASLRIPLSDKRTAFTSEFKGQVYVHLREWSEKEGESEMLKRRGICLNSEEWKGFVNALPEVRSSL